MMYHFFAISSQIEGIFIKTGEFCVKIGKNKSFYFQNSSGNRFKFFLHITVFKLFFNSMAQHTALTAKYLFQHFFSSCRWPLQKDQPPFFKPHSHGRHWQAPIFNQGSLAQNKLWDQKLRHKRQSSLVGRRTDGRANWRLPTGGQLGDAEGVLGVPRVGAHWRSMVVHMLKHLLLLL